MTESLGQRLHQPRPFIEEECLVQHWHSSTPKSMADSIQSRERSERMITCEEFGYGDKNVEWEIRTRHLSDLWKRFSIGRPLTNLRHLQ
jgi:hypothetical protein